MRAMIRDGPGPGAAAAEPLYEASETVLKKPGKAKPKKRARKPAPAVAHAPAMAGHSQRALSAAKEPVIKPSLPGFGAAVPAPQKLPPVRRAPSSRPAAQPHPLAPSNAPRRPCVTTQPPNDRFTLSLLMVPFLIVALSLGMTQSRRGGVPAMPDVVASPPVPQRALPPIAAPGAIAYQPPSPTVEIASLDVRPAPPLLPPPPAVAAEPDMIVPGPTLAYPPQGATITAPDARAANLDVRPIAPPPPPAIETAETVCRPSGEQLAAFSSIGRLARAPRRPLLAGVDQETFGRRLSEAAVAQTRDLVVYSARYQAMAYPMGDVVPFYGACIDVVIRAYRQLGIDLQEEVQKARGRRGDTNIDHRRTENMRRFLEQKGASLPITYFPESYKPGDIVTYHRPFSRVSTSHIAIVTDIIAPSGRPMIVHNRGYGAQIEDALFVDRVTGHYRYHGPAMPTQSSAAAKPAAPTAPVVRAGFPGAAGAR